MRKTQREECHNAHSLNSELMLPLDPSLIPDPCLTVSQEKGAPDDSCLRFYTARKVHDDVHDDTRIASSNVKHHHSPRVWEQLVGNEWWEIGYTHKPQAYEGHPTKFNKFNYPG